MLEEFFDLERDPHGLVNLIDDPRYADEIARMREVLAARMQRTGDPALVAFRDLGDPAALDQFLQEQEARAERAR